jgi:hypothetical protein
MVIDKDDISYSSRDVLPSGYIQLGSVSIVGDRAVFKATFAPVCASDGGLNRSMQHTDNCTRSRSVVHRSSMYRLWRWPFDWKSSVSFGNGDQNQPLKLAQADGPLIVVQVR